MKINFVNQLDIDTKEYEKLIKGVFKKVKQKGIFNIIFVSEEEIKKINNQYRNIDKITDVISFALNDTEELSYLSLDELGDIFICINKTIEQAKDYGHSVEREVAFLAVHGYLHLIGFDHLTQEDEDKMTKKQEEILEAAKIRR